MANLSKNFKKYKIAINYYNEVLKNINSESKIYANVLYRRGASYERIKEFYKSDLDLIKSLEINPDDAYVLNYLAYSWLERDYKIKKAIIMLDKAYQIKSNDPFILDSVGWAYYLINDLNKAEKFLRRAIQLMPDDPIVNDHYGDILWKMNRKIEAKYYWQSVLSFEDTEEKMKKNINNKILRGLEEI
jgi:tetratricopeptide (TPR) repeat protein